MTAGYRTEVRAAVLRGPEEPLRVETIRLRSGDLDLAPLATGETDLAGINRAFDDLAAGQVVRTLVRPGREAAG